MILFHDSCIRVSLGKLKKLIDKDKFDTDTSPPRATSVVLVSRDGTSKAVSARKEISVSAGAYCSPAIVLRSGIGPEDELANHDIPCFVSSPGIGKNLLDHLIVSTFYETEKPGLTNDSLVYHDNAIESTYMLYKERKTGVLSTFPFGEFGYARLNDRLQDSEL